MAKVPTKSKTAKGGGVQLLRATSWIGRECALIRMQRIGAQGPAT
jgi:hypothetical protein